jgi:pyruvate/2-oxoglutarate dehydrogenase complex dihydrolipoamide acyltransferase (E2) component
MQSGRVSKWLKSPGELVSIYDIIAEVTTDNLVEEAYKVDDFAGSVTLLLESQEEAYLAAVLVPEGQEIQIGAPIAVLCEDESDLSAAADAAKQLEGLNVYDEAAMQQQERSGLSLQLLEWQSYLKESGKDGSSSCGCM